MDWILAGAIGAAIAWVNYLGIRVRKLEDENKTQAEKITWLHNRCAQIEARSSFPEHLGADHR